jgi:hypothetical protein
MLPQDPYLEYPDFNPDGTPTPAIPSPPFDPESVGDDEVWVEDGRGNNEEEEFCILQSTSFFNNLDMPPPQHKISFLLDFRSHASASKCPILHTTSHLAMAKTRSPH